MNPYHLKLNLPVKFNPLEVDMKDGFHIKYKKSDIDFELRDFLDNLGIKIGFAEVFYKTPDVCGGIHIDGEEENTNFVKINYVYGGGNSLMNWYKLKPDKQIRTGNTTVGTQYLFSEPEDCEKIWSHSVGECILVNVGQLHSITEVTEPRFCYSFYLYDKNKERITWDQAIELFKGYY